MKTIITFALLACFATVAHAGQQPVYVQPVNPYTGQPVPLWQLQSDLSVAEANRSAQLSHALRQLKRQQRLQQWNDSFYDLSMLIEARRTRRAVQGLEEIAQAEAAQARSQEISRLLDFISKGPSAVPQPVQVHPPVPQGKETDLTGILTPLPGIK